MIRARVASSGGPPRGAVSGLIDSLTVSCAHGVGRGRRRQFECNDGAVHILVQPSSLRGMVRTIAGITALLCTMKTADAQTVDATRSLHLAFENDLIAVRGAGAPPDYDYTHGTRIGAAWAGAPG